MAERAYQIAFDDESVDETFYGDVVSLRVEESTMAAGTLALRLAARVLEDGTWNYMGDDRLSLFRKVSIKIGFLGGGGLAAALASITGGSGNEGLEAVFDGYITEVDVNLTSEPNNTFIEVSGMDTCVLMNLEEKTATFRDLADSDIVQQIVSAYGVDVQLDATPTVHQETDTTIAQRGTDLQFVRRLAELNGREFYFETDKESGSVKAYFRSPQLDGTPQTDLAIQFGEQSNLRSFSARLTGLRPLAVKVRQIDIKSAQENNSQSTATQYTVLGGQDDGTLFGGPVATLSLPKDSAAQMLVTGPPTSDATELQTIAQAVRDEAAWIISANGEVNSDAYGHVLRPRRLVLVKGAGDQFSGKYYVTKVTHELTGDGTYMQKFEARRNARDLDGSEQFGGGGLGLPFGL